MKPFPVIPFGQLQRETLRYTGVDIDPRPTGSQRAGDHAQDQGGASGGATDSEGEEGGARPARVERHKTRAPAEGALIPVPAMEPAGERQRGSYAPVDTDPAP